MYLNSIKDRFVRKAKHSKYLRRENSPKQLKYIKQNFHESEYVGIYNVSDQKIKAPMYHMCPGCFSSSTLIVNILESQVISSLGQITQGLKHDSKIIVIN